VDYVGRYRLEVNLFDITSDIGVPVVLAITVDRTGHGPAVTAGAAARFDFGEAAAKAIFETLQVRGASRVGFGVECPDGIPTAAKISSPTDRLYYWYPVDRIALLDRWMHTSKTIAYRRLRTGIRSCDALLAELWRRDFGVFLSDLTLPEIHHAGFEVVKVLIPELHPHFHAEAARASYSRHLGTIAWDRSLPPHPIA
jgi:ribosomal protein S12 methylthiotransferase accessory factor YcaO